MPGKTLLGSDSHTPTCGGLGMLAIGAGGLDVAVAMGGGPFYMAMPEVWLVYLTGKRQTWVRTLLSVTSNSGSPSGRDTGGGPS